MRLSSWSGLRRWAVSLLAAMTVVPSGYDSTVADDVLNRPVAKKASDTSDLNSLVIRSRADEAARAPGLDEFTRNQVAELYRSALDQLQRGDEEQRAYRLYQNRADQQRLARIVADRRSELDRLKQADQWLPSYRTQRDFEDAVLQKSEDLQRLKKSLEELETDLRQRGARRTQIQQQLPDVRAQLEDATQRLEFQTGFSEQPLVMLAQKTEVRTRKRLLEYQVARLEWEIDAYDQEEAFDLPAWQRYVLHRRIELSETEKAKLDERLKKLVTDQSKLAVLKAREEFVNSHPQLKPYAERNIQLAEEAEAMAQRIKELQTSVKNMQALGKETQEKFNYVQEKTQAIGQTGAVGLLLRKTMTELPDLASLRSNLSSRREQIDELNVKLLGFDEQLKRLRNTNAIVNQIVAMAPAVPPTDEFAEVRRDPLAELRLGATFAVERQREYVTNLKRKHETYYQLLWDLDGQERQLVATTEKFSHFINERVLWIRSGQILGPSEFENASRQEIALFSPMNWAAVVKALRGDFFRHPEVTLIGVLVFFALLRINRLVGRHLRECGQEASRPTCTDLWLTTRVLGLSVVRSIVFPIVPAFLGWRLFNAASDNPFSIAVANGLMMIAMLGFPMRLMSLLCKHDGLAEAHLQWSAHACELIRRHTRWLMASALSLVFVSVVLDETSRDPDYSVLERLIFIASMLTVAGFCRRIFRPTSGVFQGPADESEISWSHRWRQACYYTAQAFPVALATMSVLGYDYTARQLGWRILSTGWFAVSMVIVAGVMLRQVAIRHRKLTYQVTGTYPIFGAGLTDDVARKYYSSAEAGYAPKVAGEAVSLTRMMNQTVRLIRAMAFVGFMAGCWMIWSDVVPALSAFDSWPLWSIDVVQLDAAGKSITTSKPVTIPHVMLASMMAVVTWISVKNIPGLLDFTLLERLPIDKSVRYAVNALAAYAVTLIGAIMVFGTLGVSWSNVQWLATALTFGLAFGLQEVFANFVSGIIILFERPLRVGDVVTIGDVTGEVSQIRMRATTIINGDRQEFIVPNKEFITGRLLNWTLTDQVNRVVVSVGAAYGSNPDQVRNLMLQVANRHPHVLHDPAPTVTFESFGESNLVFTLRAFLPDIAHRMETINDLHTQIYKLLNEQGVEMAFPQRDINIRELPPELVKAFGGHSDGPQTGGYSRVA